jgi:hypothetical protein
VNQNNIESWNNRTKEETLPVLCGASRGITVWCRPLALARQTTYPLVHNQERSVLPQPTKEAECTIPEKWPNFLPTTFFPNWVEVWNRRRPKKEVGFMWSVYHGAVITNFWKACISVNIDTSCDCCKEVPPESLIHRFHHCSKAAHAWRYAKTLLYPYVNLLPYSLGIWPDLTWQQCLMGSPLPHNLKTGSKLWSLLKGSIMWISWIDWNAICFHTDPWPTAKIEQVVWDTLQDHARATWKHYLTCIRLYPASIGKVLFRFDETWGANGLVCMWDEFKSLGAIDVLGLVYLGNFGYVQFVFFGFVFLFGILSVFGCLFFAMIQ